MAPVTNRPSESASGILGTRAEAMQRLKVGVGGLLSVLLVVAIASSVLQSARDAEDTPAAAKQTTTETTNDPLVDIGVAPELPGETKVIVPDLPAEQMPPEARGDAPPPADSSQD